MPDLAPKLVVFVDQVSDTSDRLLEVLQAGGTSQAVGISALLATAATLLESNPQHRPDAVQALLPLMRIVVGEFMAHMQSSVTH